MTIYLLSGLGADERIFQNLHFGAWTPVYIPWIEVNSILNKILSFKQL